MLLAAVRQPQHMPYISICRQWRLRTNSKYTVTAEWRYTMANPTFTITMENGGVITGELYPEKAPQSVYNFISLANSGYYNGLIFHRVIPGFMI